MAKMLRQLAACLLALTLVSCAGSDQRGPLILAAVSLQEVLSDAADQWEAKGNTRPVLSFAGTPALARQIESGAEADLFIAADQLWIDYLADLEKINLQETRTIASNRLVLIEPLAVDAERSLPFTIADPAAVPAGRYAQAALTSLGMWDQYESRLVPTENVRATLRLVERGEAQGVVYATDAQASGKVAVTRKIPASSHTPIAYVAAPLPGDQRREAERFLAFLQTDEGLALFDQHGFTRSK